MKKRSLAVNAVFSSLNSFLSIIFPLITFPYISRILQVDNIGAVNFGSSVLSYFILIAAFGINTFAIRNGSGIRDDREKLNRFVNQVFTINLITALASYVLLLILLVLSDKMAAYRGILLIQSVTLISAPFAMEWLYAVLEDFAYITYRNFIVKIFSLALIFVFVRTGDDVLKYVAISSLSVAIANFYNFFHARRILDLHPVRETGWKDKRKSLMVFFLNSISSTIYMNFDTTMLGFMCGDTSVGFYTVATKLYLIAKQLINASVSSTIPRLAFYFENERQKFTDLISRMLRIVIFLTVPMAAGFILLSRDIIIFISGQEYIPAAPALNFLSVAIIFGILANVLANGVLVGARRENLVICCTITSSAVNFALNLVAIYAWQQTGAAVTTLISEIVMVVMSLWFAREFITDRRQIAKTFFHTLAATFIMAAVTVCIHMATAGYRPVIRITAVSLAGVVIYFAVQGILRDDIMLMMWDMAVQKIKREKK